MKCSELNRERSHHDKEHRLGDLEQELVAAARGTPVKLSVTAIQKKGLLTVLREWTPRK
jgi:hypothetical protein